MYNNFRVVALATLMMALAMAPVRSARAALAIDLYSPVSNSGPCDSSCGSVFGVTIGYSFTVINAITVDGLGIWDVDADGIGTSISVGIWSSGGSLLASTAITDASTPVGSASSAGDWLFEAVVPFVLSPGDYRIGMTFKTGSLAEINSPLVFDPNIVLTSGVVSPGGADSGLAYPSANVPVGVIGANFRIAVPEPGTFAIFGVALALLAVSRRRG